MQNGKFGAAALSARVAISSSGAVFSRSISRTYNTNLGSGSVSANSERSLCIDAEKTKQLCREKLNFFAVSDFGVPNRSIYRVAAAMQRYAVEVAAPDFIAGLGDNFYPEGVRTRYDSKFDSHWRDVFIRDHPQLRVPWRMVLGNHDYMGLPFEQIQYHYDATLNREGLWYMPDCNYTFCYDMKPPMNKSVRGNGSSGGGSSSGADTVHRSNKCSAAIKQKDFKVQFFALDTNGCQGHVRLQWPRTATALRDYISDLAAALESSTSDWKILLGHHPMYTQGAGHGPATRSLRSTHFTRYSLFGFPHEYRGYGLEEVLVKGSVQAYFSGHEHVFQVTHPYTA